MHILSKLFVAVATFVASYHFVYFVKNTFYPVENSKKCISKSNIEEEIINEVLFFCNDGIACRKHFNQKQFDIKTCSFPHCPFYNMNRMQHYLESATISLDICLYLITVKDLATAIIKAKLRGVSVRVFTDEDMENGSGSQIPYFRQHGLFVRRPKNTTTLMHHKFVIIDGKILMSGSLNWTMQALCGNWDNLIITSQPEIVTAFSQEYERLWTSVT